ncbi:NACHT domain-containing protein [Streptomyces sp. 900116325]
MTRYDLTRMGPHEFQRLAQALLLAEFGSHIQIHGMGPDGGRDASTRSDLRVSATNPPWTGFTVFQVKHKEELTRRTADAQWLLKELKTEVGAWLKREEKPQQLLVITNVVLTPAEGGGEELINEYIESITPALKLRDSDVWHAEKICRLLDLHPTVRQRYLGSVMGDLLTTLTESISETETEISDSVSGHLARVFKAEKYAELDQGGGVDDRKVPLARVFVDVPYVEKDEEDGFLFDEQSQEDSASTATIIGLLDSQSTPIDRSQEPSRGRILVIGGPGQGKSTLGRFLCQIYRSELLDRHRFLGIQGEIANEVQRIRIICKEEGIPLPASLRFPMFVSLPKFANYLAENPSRTLMSFIAERVGDGATITAMRRWLRKYPWLLVLDGLDEVPSTANRGPVLEAISSFNDSADACGADLAIVATSRPQGYKDEFSSFKTMFLSQLHGGQVLRYSRRLTAIRHGEGSDKATEIMERVERAAGQAETARLMTTPLQVTILVLLLSRSSVAPSQRYVLFSNYYQVIYSRELEKDTPHAAILDRFRTFIDLLHWRIGFRLQCQAAEASHTESSLTREDMQIELEAILDGEGYEEDDRAFLVSQIMNAATDRLVFLVARTSEYMGFELRSLQEFCAANGVLEGNDEVVYDRLTAIVCSDHWRNTFLLASGAIFSTNSARRDMITSICNELNSGDISEFPGSDGALLGSRLAIDILADRVSDTAPRHQRMLTETSIAIVGLAGDNSLLKLSHIDFTDAASRKKVSEAVTRAASSENMFDRLGALIAISSAVEAGSATAYEKFLAVLHGEETSAKLRLLQSGLSSNQGRSAMTRALLEDVAQFTPAEAKPLLIRAYRSALEDPDDWFEGPRARFMLRITIFARQHPIRVGTSTKYRPSIFHINAPDSPSDFLQEIATDAADFENAGSWEFLRRAVLFAHKPSPASWTFAVDTLNASSADDVHAWWLALPWPLALWWERGRPTVAITDETIKEWQEAQQGWTDVDLDESLRVRPELMPRVSGVPAYGLSTVPSNLTYNQLRDFALSLAVMPNDRFREVRTSWLWSALDASPHGHAILSSLPTSAITELAPSSVSVNLIVSLILTGEDDCIELANTIGKLAEFMSIRVRAGIPPRFAMQVYKIWISQPSRWGLARVLLRLPYVETGDSWRQVRSLDTGVDNDFRKLVAIWGGTWEESELIEISQCLLDLTTGQNMAPIGYFDKFVRGRGGAVLAEMLKRHEDGRYLSVVHRLHYHYSTKIVPIPRPTFQIASSMR